MPATGTPATGPADAESGVAAVVVAAGRGIRIGGSTPKQYRRVGGQAVLTRTLAALAAQDTIDRIQPVIAADAADFFLSCLDELAPGLREKIVAPVEGGATRQLSVRAGLEALAKLGAPEIVLVHDAARPYVDAALIARAIAAGRDHGAAVPG
ncbi:NTP transferase domain-containing protein, partial [Methylobacterium sp. WL18]|uniref:IspD/TarI family cytidylyltransferase n=1 Tax=Methylobacterium sp. WL18 TaxID=2603897 RepID=UPI0011C90347